MFVYSTYKTKLSSETNQNPIQTNQKMAASFKLRKNKKFCGDSIGTFSEISRTCIDIEKLKATRIHCS